MKSTTAAAKAMTDAQLADRAQCLRREIPVAQSLLNAITREQARRTRKQRAGSTGART